MRLLFIVAPGQANAEPGQTDETISGLSMMGRGQIVELCERMKSFRDKVQTWRLLCSEAPAAERSAKLIAQVFSPQLRHDPALPQENTTDFSLQAISDAVERNEDVDALILILPGMAAAMFTCHFCTTVLGLWTNFPDFPAFVDGQSCVMDMASRTCRLLN